MPLIYLIYAKPPFLGGGQVADQRFAAAYSLADAASVSDDEVEGRATAAQARDARAVSERYGVRSDGRHVSEADGVRRRPDRPAESAAKLMSRIAALDVPPRPIAVGALQTPAGERFSQYGRPSRSRAGAADGAAAGGAWVSAGGVNSPSEDGSLGPGSAASSSRFRSSWPGGKVVANGWRPRGILVSNLVEHQGAVNSIAVAQDDSFFVTASDDGTAKVWDTRGLGTDVIVRPSFSYTSQVRFVIRGGCIDGWQARQALRKPTCEERLRVPTAL